MKKKIIIGIFCIFALALSFTSVYTHKPSKKKQKLAKKTQEPYLTVAGFSLMSDGLGRHAVELIDALDKDIDIGFASSREFLIFDGVPAKVKRILKQKRPIAKVVFYVDWLGEEGLSYKTTLVSPKNSTSIRIAYSMFEASAIPPEWVVALNNYFDAVAVPDKFLIDVYRSCGVTIPIFEVPLGLNLDNYYNAPLKNTKNSPMVFANFSTATPRKNQLRLIQAFHAAFGNSKKVQLKLNSRAGDLPSIQAMENEIHRLGATNIDFTLRTLDNDLYLKAFQEIDCYVSLSSGEGFSIQPREAMALGVPVIVTDNTGQSTICDSKFGRAVPSLNPIPAFYPTFGRYYGSFYDCTIKDAAEALTDVYQNHENYLQQAAAARIWVKQSSSYDQLTPLYLGLVRPKKVVLGNINKVTPDCLFTDSAELCTKFHQLTGAIFENQQTIPSKESAYEEK